MTGALRGRQGLALRTGAQVTRPHPSGSAIAYNQRSLAANPEHLAILEVLEDEQPNFELVKNKGPRTEARRSARIPFSYLVVRSPKAVTARGPFLESKGGALLASTEDERLKRAQRRFVVIFNIHP